MSDMNSFIYKRNILHDFYDKIGLYYKSNQNNYFFTEHKTKKPINLKTKITTVENSKK